MHPSHPSPYLTDYRQLDPLAPPTVRFDLRHHIVPSYILQPFRAAGAIRHRTLVAFHGLYAPMPTYKPCLVATGYAVWTDHTAYAGAFTLASKSQMKLLTFHPSLARLLAMALPAAGLVPGDSPGFQELRSTQSTVFLHFLRPDLPAWQGARHAFSPTLPDCQLPPVPLGMRVPFGPSQVYTLDLVLMDTTFIAGDLKTLTFIASRLPLPLVQLSAAEQADPGLLLRADPDKLLRYAAQRAELTLISGSSTAADLIRVGRASSRAWWPGYAASETDAEIEEGDADEVAED